MLDTSIENEELKSHWILRHFPKLLSRWHGQKAKLTELTVSYQSLRITVSDVAYESYLQISCLVPHSMHGEFEWSNSFIHIRLLESGKYQVYDHESNFVLVCASVEIKEFA